MALSIRARTWSVTRRPSCSSRTSRERLWASHAICHSRRGDGASRGSTSIHLIQSGIAKLLALFPDKRFNPVERNEYNRQMQDVFEDVRDFIVLHYKATRRQDSDFWDYCRTMDVPDKLAAKLDLWRSKGRIFREGAELFGTPSWVAVLFGQGVVPEDYEPAADAMDAAQLSDVMHRMRVGYRDMAQRMPTHAEFIARACPARQ